MWECSRGIWNDPGMTRLHSRFRNIRESESFLVNFLHHSDHRVQPHRHDTQQHDGHEQPVHLENLARVNDQISQSVPCCQEFSDYNTHEAEPDVDFHIADDRRNRAWKHNFKQCVPAIPVECIDEFDLFFVNRGKTGVQVHDAPEYGDGHTGYDDCCRGSTKPYDQKRRQCGFRQTVQYYQIGFQYFGKPAAAPEQNRDQDTGECYKQETYDRLIQCNADMQEDRPVQHHLPEAKCDPGGTAEDKRIDNAIIGAYFPQKQKKNEDQNTCGTYENTVPAQFVQKKFLSIGRQVRRLLHHGSAPSIFH